MPHNSVMTFHMSPLEIDRVMAELLRRGYLLKTPLDKQPKEERLNDMSFYEPKFDYDTPYVASYRYGMYPQHTYPTVRRLNAPGPMNNINEYMRTLGLQIEKELLKSVLTGDKAYATLKTSNTGEKQMSQQVYERTFTDWNTAVTETEGFSQEFDAFTDAMANFNSRFHDAHREDEITEGVFMSALAEGALRAYNTNRYRVEITHRKVVIEKFVFSTPNVVYNKIVEFELLTTFATNIVVRVYRNEKDSEWKLKA